MGDKHFKISIGFFLETVMLVRNFLLGKIRISVTANSIDQS